MTTSPKIISACIAWDQTNPKVYPLFCRFTQQLVARGRTRLSAKLIFERIRWEAMLTTTGDTFKLNNNFTAIYARRFMNDYPQHAGLFATRDS